MVLELENQYNVKVKLYKILQQNGKSARGLKMIDDFVTLLYIFRKQKEHDIELKDFIKYTVIYTYI